MIRKKEKTHIQIIISPELKNEFTELVSERDLNSSQVLRELIRWYIKNNKNTDGEQKTLFD